MYWKGGHHTYFLDGGNNWGGENILLVGGHHTYFVDEGYPQISILYDMNYIVYKI